MPRPSTPRSAVSAKRALGARRATSSSNRVQVAVRLRPMSTYDRNTEQAIFVEPGNCIALGRDRERKFFYDFVFTEGQEQVFDSIGKPMLADAFEGYNVCLFAYGQTGSGKTYSILGGNSRESEGIIPRFCRDMFAMAQEKLDEDPTLTIKISMSYIEIYNEKVRDLLEKKKSKQAELTSLEIHEDTHKKVYVEGLSIHTVINYDRIRKLIDFGNSQRQVSETKMNEKSSRSHSIIQFELSQKYDPPTPEKRDVESLLTLVDLAGSERQSKTEATGLQFDESRKINHSLLMLGRALNSFSDGKGAFVPLRESKLTRLLSECFGGNARTWMLACVSPSAFNYSETVSTLDYAQNAKAIINKAKVNSLQQRLELRELREAHAKLTELYDMEKDKVRQMAERMQEQDDELTALRIENAMLKKNLEDVLLDHSRVRGELETARTRMVEIAKETTVVKRTPSASNMQYIGRAKVSLRNIIEQTSNYLTLPLVSDVPGVGDGAQLIVNIYPVDSKGCSTLDNATRTQAKDLLGHRVDFVVHIISARGLPKKFSHSVYCKYVYKWAEKDSYKTNDVADNCNPDFDFKKRFAFSKMNQGLVEYFQSDNVITFEVIGKARPLDEEDGELPSPQ